MNLLHTEYDFNSTILDCIGNYDKSDPLCMKHCALRLRCSIEKDQNLRTELLEELINADGEIEKIQ